VCAILAALKYEGAESQLISLLATLQHLFGSESISLCIAVVTSKTAVQTVATAVARKFD
jgi:hypothetical protein